MRTFKASEGFRGVLTGAELQHMEKHPSEKAIEIMRQVPFHLQCIREEKAKQAQKEAEKQKNEETEERKIEALIDRIEYCNDSYSDICLLDEDIALIKNVLGKQIHKKPIGEYKNWQGVNVGYKCPNCNANVEYEDACGGYGGRMMYCDHCGQRIDWE